MAYAVLRYRPDFRQWREEIRRIQAGPDSHLLESTLEHIFLETQRTVHAVGMSATGYVRTGSLRASGKRSVGADVWTASGRWQGSISYGGAAPGAVNNPVKYAAFEEHRHGHEYMPDEEEANRLWEDTIADWMRGR